MEETAKLGLNLKWCTCLNFKNAKELQTSFAITLEKYCYNTLRANNKKNQKTYKSWWIVISDSFGISKCLQHRIGLNNLIFQIGFFTREEIKLCKLWNIWKVTFFWLQLPFCSKFIWKKCSFKSIKYELLKKFP